ncbi:hypothetical protein HLY00_3219 [Mycolicibacterium hippocampi]|uniref:Uncharacterized protein n=1 Tax=Mycolicibacterium hippocampi TaxID=659824 RepID=A0A850PU02_9MYCO|nr:hypothetical protein [Mycolicibacterium hippocampi]
MNWVPDHGGRLRLPILADSAADLGPLIDDSHALEAPQSYEIRMSVATERAVDVTMVW